MVSNYLTPTIPTTSYSPPASVCVFVAGGQGRAALGGEESVGGPAGAVLHGRDQPLGARRLLHHLHHHLLELLRLLQEAGGQVAVGGWAPDGVGDLEQHGESCQ